MVSRVTKPAWTALAKRLTGLTAAATTGLILAFGAGVLGEVLDNKPVENDTVLAQARDLGAMLEKLSNCILSLPSDSKAQPFMYTGEFAEPLLSNQPNGQLTWIHLYRIIWIRQETFERKFENKTFATTLVEEFLKRKDDSCVKCLFAVKDALAALAKAVLEKAQGHID
jgi:hypothetical protein